MNADAQIGFLELRDEATKHFKEYASAKLEFENLPSDLRLKSILNQKSINWINALNEFDNYTPNATV